MATAKKCTCWADRNKELAKQGYVISQKCSMLGLTKKTLDLTVVQCLPISRLDGKPLKRKEPKVITISHCPFCGKKL